MPRSFGALVGGQGDALFGRPPRPWSSAGSPADPVPPATPARTPAGAGRRPAGAPEHRGERGTSSARSTRARQQAARRERRRFASSKLGQPVGGGPDLAARPPLPPRREERRRAPVRVAPRSSSPFSARPGRRRAPRGPWPGCRAGGRRGPVPSPPLGPRAGDLHRGGPAGLGERARTSRTVQPSLMLPTRLTAAAGERRTALVKARIRRARPSPSLGRSGPGSARRGSVPPASTLHPAREA